jgi:hypothetical protein
MGFAPIGEERRSGEVNPSYGLKRNRTLRRGRA